MDIKLTVDDCELLAVLNGSATALALAAVLPLKLSMSRWGDEYYGSLGAKLDVSPAADARDLMSVGELAYWHPGTALCIFFGRTPASVGDEPRAASAVDPIGQVSDGVEQLKGLGQSVSVTVEAVN